MLPHARDEKLLVEELREETIVFDLERDKAHHLNRTAALIWRHCDGRTTVAELATGLRKLDLPADEEVVWLALDRLEKAHLLRGRLERPADVESPTRRQVMRKLGMAGGLALLLPVVTSMVAPTPARAASGILVAGCPGGCTSSGPQCTCIFGFCSTILPGTPCVVSPACVCVKP
jgi:hypothetical protein